MIPSAGRGVSITRMRSRAIFPVSFFSAIVVLPLKKVAPKK
jgi:hypothetical protein